MSQPEQTLEAVAFARRMEQAAFARAEAEALAVVDSFLDRRVLGLLTEAYVLRRYTAELERRRREIVGDE